MTWQKEERRKLNWDHRWMTERAKREGTQTALQQDPLQYFWVRNINRSIDWSVSLLLFLCAYIFSSVSVTACVFLASIFFVPSILGLYMPTYIRLRDRFCLCPLASSFSASAYLLNGLCIFLLVFLCICDSASIFASFTVSVYTWVGLSSLRRPFYHPGGSHAICRWRRLQSRPIA